MTKPIVRPLIAGMASLLISSTLCGSATQPGSGAVDEIRQRMSERLYEEAAAAATARLEELASAGEAEGDEAAELTALLAKAIFRKGGSRAEVAEWAQKALALQERLWGPENLRIADTLSTLAMAKLELDERSVSATLAERVLAIRQRHLESDDPLVASSFNLIGTLAFLRHDFAAARDAFEGALATLEEAFGPEHSELVRPLNNLGNALRELGDLERARHCYRRGIGIVESSPDAPSAWLVQPSMNLANLERREGDYEASRRHMERAVAIARENPDRSKLSWVLRNLAGLLRDIGDYPEARRVATEALSIGEELLGSRHSTTASVLEVLGFVSVELGDLDAAERYYKRSLEIYRQLGWSTSMAFALHSLGEVAVLRGHLEAAHEAYERALETLEEALGPDHSDIAHPLLSLGDLALVVGRLDEASSRLERALRLRQATTPNHPIVGRILQKQAELHLSRGEPKEAVSLLDQSLDVLHQSLGEHHPLSAEALAQLAVARWAAGNGEEALADALLAEEIGREHLRVTARRIDDRSATAYATARPKGLDLASSLAGGGLPATAAAEVWDSAIRSRAVVLEEVVARRAALSSTADPEVRRLADRLAAASRRLSNLAVASLADKGDDRPSSEETRQRIDRLRLEKQSVESDLAARSEAYGRSRARALVGLDDVRSALPRGTGLIAYQRYLHHSKTPGPPTPSYLAWLLDRERRVRVVPLGEARTIDGAIEGWRREAGTRPPPLKLQLRRAIERSRARGDAVRRLVWDPLAAHLEGLEKVFVVPDGALHRLSLAALPAAEGGYLVESGPLLHLLTAERDLVAKPARARGEGLLLVSAPDFQASPAPIVVAATDVGEQSGAGGAEVVFRGAHASCREFADLRFDALPAAFTEGREISALWRQEDGTEVLELTGPRAQETAFKRNARGRRVLHLATHGFIMRDACADGGDQDPPLLLAGLGLAGANRRAEAAEGEDDGILTAEEVATLDLSGVEWAVLSGCDTGLGDIVSGEGVVGLRRAFHAAGARTVIMSLWPVADEAAKRFMTELYAARLAGASTAEAVRRATLAQLAAQRRSHGSGHPFDWGAWVAAGDWS